jgi:hypothetical protein
MELVTLLFIHCVLFCVNYLFVCNAINLYKQYIITVTCYYLNTNLYHPQCLLPSPC